jgi:hypothetical protein
MRPAACACSEPDGAAPMGKQALGRNMAGLSVLVPRGNELGIVESAASTR